MGPTVGPRLSCVMVADWLGAEVWLNFRYLKRSVPARTVYGVRPYILFLQYSCSTTETVTAAARTPKQGPNLSSVKRLRGTPHGCRPWSLLESLQENGAWVR
eukprot:2762256-Prymnesium_polylepis.2